MLADVLLKVAGMTAKKPSEYFPRPSMAGPERCMRQMVFWGLKTTPDTDIPDRMMMVFDDSSWHEELTNDWIRKTTYKLHSTQMPVNCIMLDFVDSELKRYCKICKKEIHANILHGHIDGIITDLDFVDILFDHKAINHFTFQRFWEGKETPDDYFSQLAVYISGLQKTANPNLKKLLLLIKNKNTSQYMEYQCEYEDFKTDTLIVTRRLNSNGESEEMNLEYNNIVKNAVDKFRVVDDYINKKTLPKRQYYKDSWRCNYCQFPKRCWEGYVEEQLPEPEELPDDYIMKLELRNRWKEIEPAGKKAYEEIKNYMRLNNLLVATAGGMKITRKLATKGRDRFSFKKLEGKNDI